MKLCILAFVSAVIAKPVLAQELIECDPDRSTLNRSVPGPITAQPNLSVTLSKDGYQMHVENLIYSDATETIIIGTHSTYVQYKSDDRAMKDREFVSIIYDIHGMVQWIGKARSSNAPEWSDFHKKQQFDAINVLRSRACTKKSQEPAKAGSGRGEPNPSQPKRDSMPIPSLTANPRLLEPPRGRVVVTHLSADQTKSQNAGCSTPQKCPTSIAAQKENN